MIKAFIISNFHKFNHFIDMKPDDKDEESYQIDNNHYRFKVKVIFNYRLHQWRIVIEIEFTSYIGNR